MTSQHDVTPKMMSNLIWFSSTWRNWFFAWLTKIAAGMVLTVTHQWFCNWVRAGYQLILWKEKVDQMLYTFFQTVQQFTLYSRILFVLFKSNWNKFVNKFLRTLSSFELSCLQLTIKSSQLATVHSKTNAGYIWGEHLEFCKFLWFDFMITKARTGAVT